MLLLSFEGTVFSDEKRVYVQAEKASYRKESLILEGDVLVEQHLRRLTSTYAEVILGSDSADDLGAIRAVKCQGHTHLTFTDDETDLERILECFGGIYLDNENSQVYLYSPEDADGNGEQVLFRDLLGEISGNEMLLDFIYEDSKPTLISLSVEGDVRILNKKSELGLDQIQYALADTADFNFRTQELTLKSSDETGVLFFDKINNMQMNAPEIIVKRDRYEQIESVEGIGTVRLVFDESELERMNNTFHMKG